MLREIYEIDEIYKNKEMADDKKLYEGLRNLEGTREGLEPYENSDQPQSLEQIETKYDWERKIDDYRHDWYEILELQELDIDYNYSEALKAARKKINALLEMGIAKGYITPEEKDIISSEFVVTQDQERKL